MHTVLKAVPCVVQNGAILCFRHPSAGNQIPKGTVETGECVSAAALREIEEESGLVHDGAIISIGVFDRFVGGGPREDGALERHVWNVFLLPACGLPESWDHEATGNSEEQGLVFSYFWQSLSEQPTGFAGVFLRVIDMLRETLSDPKGYLDKTTLVDPTTELASAFLDMATEWRLTGEDRFAGAFCDFDGYVLALMEKQQPVPPLSDEVPCNAFWLVGEDGRVLGTSRLRHRLTPGLMNEGGNIGYDIRPSARGRGYGTLILSHTLRRARMLGLREVLVTCDSDNAGSIRVIERNCGRLIDVVTSMERGVAVNRYRIALL